MVESSVRSSRKNPCAGTIPLNTIALASLRPSSPMLNVHPVRSIASSVGLWSSIHSSLGLAGDPAPAASLMTRARTLFVVEAIVGAEVGVNVTVSSVSGGAMLAAPMVTAPLAKSALSSPVSVVFGKRKIDSSSTPVALPSLTPPSGAPSKRERPPHPPATGRRRR